MIEIKNRLTGALLIRLCDVSDLREANLCEADLREADLREADLRGADLCGADLREADLDFSVWPLWCGPLDVMVDFNIASQIAYHFCALQCDDALTQKMQSLLRNYANGSPVRVRHKLPILGDETEDKNE